MPVLATFNVKDLLDAAHTEKLEWTAKMLARMDADVVGLQEVGTMDVLQAVLDRVPNRGGYGEPIMGTPDGRGIRCALLSRLPVLASQVHTSPALPFPVFQAGDPPPFGDRLALRRGVVWARVQAGEGFVVDVFTAHFKSGLPVPMKDAAGQPIAPTTAREHGEGAVRALVSRAAEALYVRSLVDAVLAEDPSRHVVVMGDLNDFRSSLPVRLVTAARSAAPLFDCAEIVPFEKRRSILFESGPAVIDHVLVTEALRQRLQDARYLDEDLRHHPWQEAEPGAPPASPSLDSDHAPFVVTFM